VFIITRLIVLLFCFSFGSLVAASYSHIVVHFITMLYLIEYELNLNNNFVSTALDNILITFVCMHVQVPASPASTKYRALSLQSMPVVVGDSAKRRFDSINHASDINEEFKRSFDSISHTSDLDEDRRLLPPADGVKRNFDSIDHVSDMDETKRSFDSIDHASDLEEGKRSPVVGHGEFSTRSAVGDRRSHAMFMPREILPQLPAWKRMFDSIGHTTDMDDFKRSFDSIQHSTDMDEVKRSTKDASSIVELRRLAAALRSPHLINVSLKRNFDPIDHSSDIETFKRSSNLDVGRRSFDSIEHASDMGDVKRMFDSI